MFITIIGWVLIVAAIFFVVGGFAKNEDGSKTSKQDKRIAVVVAIILLFVGGYMTGHHGRQVKAEKAAESSSIAKVSSKKAEDSAKNKLTSSEITNSKDESKTLAKASSEAESREKENMKKPNPDGSDASSEVNTTDTRANKIGFKPDKSKLKEEGYVWVPKDTTNLNVKFSIGEDNKINGAKIMEHGTREGMLKFFRKVTADDLKEIDDPDNPDLYYSKKLDKYYHVGSWEDSSMKNIYKSAQLNAGKNADEMN